jgi:hypothetical protein
VGHPDDIPEKDNIDYSLQRFEIEHFKKSAEMCLIFKMLKDSKEKMEKMNATVAALMGLAFFDWSS